MTVKQLAGSGRAPDGSQYVTLTDGDGNLGSTITATSTENMAQIGGNTVSTGNGVSGTGVQRVTIASDSTGIVALPAAGTSVVGTKAAGTAGATSALTGGVYNSTVPVLTNGQQIASQFDTTGAQQVNIEGKKATYRAVDGLLALTANGVFCGIQGSATKTVRINRIAVSGSLTTSAPVIVEIFRTTADVTSASGTTTKTAALMDSGNAAATAVVKTYTTSTVGTGNIGVSIGRFQAGSATVPQGNLIFEYGKTNGQALVLRGTAQFAQVFINTSSYTGASFDVEVEWTEE